MWIERDFLNNIQPDRLLEAILIRGPRQIGKSSILSKIKPLAKSELYLDDITLRAQAIENPDFLLNQSGTPLLIDEVQLAPALFPAIKKTIDEGRRLRLSTGQPVKPASYRLTGSNQLLLDQNIKESLAGRVSQFYLQGLSYGEVLRFKPDLRISDFLLRGGFPELWVRPELSAIQYLNDYISTFIERDLARVAGIEKLNEFLKILKFLAARSGELLNYETLGGDAGVAGKTVKDWVGLLERNQVIMILPVYSSNLNKRLIKMPKVYFHDLGLCVRLQAHQETDTLLYTSLGGHLFETLVVSEVAKIKLNYQKDWQLSFWRTKEKEEIDLIIESDQRLILVEIKLNSSGARNLPEIPPALNRLSKPIERIVVIGDESRLKLPSGWNLLPLRDLRDYLIG